ncbi:MAG: TonB-dependent receptor [Nitrosomonas sp.]|nr:TonB-dependent receptor [Nitrosomonas sp.]
MNSFFTYLSVFFRKNHLYSRRIVLTATFRKFILVSLACLSGKIVIANDTNLNKAANNPFLDLPIAELTKIEITSVSRRSQKLQDVASAVFVITQDDIRRSGATSIPEALRMAPGVQVDRIGTDKWAISIRGFNGRYANKLQVLIDGRSVYTPLFSGTFWEQQDTLMEDIDRIEVIRGPAATVWGINSVNGVINVITKKAADTQGTLLTAGGGTFEQGFVGARYGGKINDDTPFRIFAKGFTRNDMMSPLGQTNRDEWHSVRGGFRIDHSRGIDQFTLQGDLFSNFIGNNTYSQATLDPTIPLVIDRGRSEGGNIRLRWDRAISEQSSIMLQTYYDHVNLKLPAITSYMSESFDIDFQHRFPFLTYNDLTWGFNYRLYHTKLTEGNLIQLSPSGQTNQVFSGFIRNDIKLIPDRLMFSIGTRLDRNDFTGLEIQPNARLMWTPTSYNSVWGSISRAVRTPSRIENDGEVVAGYLPNLPGLNLGLPLAVQAIFQGNHAFKSEKLIAYELGYRHQFSPQASIDIAGFVNDYSELRDLSMGAFSFVSGVPRHVLLSLMGNNKASGLTYGVEISGDWKPTDKWRLQGNYSFLDMNISSDASKRYFDPTSNGADKVNQQHHISVRSHYDVSDKLQLNLWLRYVSGISYYKIPGYVTMDAKLAFNPNKKLELFLVGQNLFAQNHQEAMPDFIYSFPGLIPRGFYAGAQLRF